MSSMPAIATGSPSEREIVHDLRNLFGVVASAGHLLEDDPQGIRRTRLLEAIEDAASRGSQLTTALLASAEPRPRVRIDVNARIASLEPMMHALAGRAAVHFERSPIPLPARLDAAGLDAAVLELVANARNALAAWNQVIVRARPAGKRIWLTVADDGDGMTAAELAEALRGRGAARGNGLARVAEFVRNAHGRMRIRTRKGTGTAVTISLPMILGMAGVQHPAPAPEHQQENSDEER